jgi:hypothetical protein
VRDILDRKRQAPIDTKRRIHRGRRGGHAEPAVVVDVRRAECDARELAEQIGLLVRQRSATEDAHRVAARLLLHVRERVRDAIERRVPARRDELASRRSNERRRQPVWMGEGRARGPSFDAEAALVHGEPGVPQHLRRFALSRDEHPALQRAVGAMRRDRATGRYARSRHGHVVDSSSRACGTTACVIRRVVRSVRL